MCVNFTLLFICIAHMKKWFLPVVVIVVLLLLAAVYLLIPSNLTVLEIQSVKCNVNGASSYLGQAGNWSKWWPPERVGKAGDPDGKAGESVGKTGDADGKAGGSGIYYKIKGG